MRTSVLQHGFTLVEAVVAASLVLVMAGGLAQLLLLGRRLMAHAEEVSVATTAASTRLERLRAVVWAYGIDGTSPEVAALGESPPDALTRNVEGFYERLDAAGRSWTPGEEPRMVCRWAVMTGGAPEARSLEVCVFPWPAGPEAAQLVCLASARGRQP